MSIGKIIMSLGKTCSRPVSAAPKNFWNSAGVVAVKDMLAGKATADPYRVKNLLNLPAADEFIKSAGKQEATIISDNFVRFKDYGSLHRVITKRLPTGTTVAKAFDEVGALSSTYTEVISENGFVRSANHLRRGGNYIQLYGRNKKGDFYKLSSRPWSKEEPLAKLQYVPSNCQVNKDLFDEKIRGSITELSNANNKDYLGLLRLGLIHKVR